MINYDQYFHQSLNHFINRLTVGQDNVLFHLISSEKGSGIFVTNINDAQELQSELLQNFHTCVAYIRQVLQIGSRNKVNIIDHYIGKIKINVQSRRVFAETTAVHQL